jgi:signal transduction histidine kinase
LQANAAKSVSCLATMRSIDRSAPVSVAALALAIALGAGAAASLLAVGQAKRAAKRDVASAMAVTSAAVQAGASPAAVLASLDSVAAVDSAKLYRASGERIADYQRPPQEVRFRALAQRVFPTEVACSGIVLGGAPATLCIESAPDVVAPAIAQSLMLLAIASIVGLLAGAATGMLVARSAAKPLARAAEVIDRAAHEQSYSLRVPDDLGPLSRATNELLAHIQERELALRRRTTELEAANKDLESFAFSVSHDLRAPLGSIDGFTQALEMDYKSVFDETAREYLSWIREGCRQMRDLIDGLLQMSRVSRLEVQRQPVDLSGIAQSVAESLRQSNPSRAVTFEIRDNMRTIGDERLLRAVIENLMSNAWKFTRNRPQARIEVGEAGGAYYVRDNGAGFDPSHAAKMFRPFQRLHSAREFEGTGIGLATVQKIVERHGGRAWAEGEVEKGATVFFTTGDVAAA